MSSRDDAVELLIHYLQTVWVAAGLKWTDENAAEVASIVEHILDAAHYGGPA